MTKYVISGYIGFDNFGDEAICGVLTNYLKQNGAEQVTVISANPEKTSRLYGVESVPILDFIKPIRNADVLISGGGSLLQDVTSLRSLLYYIAVIMTALVYGKQVYIFAQGITPFRTIIGKLLAGFVLKRCHKITVRDRFSQEYLEKMGISSELIADPVFGLETPTVEKHEGVGIQLRGCSSVNDEFLNLLAENVARTFKNKEIKLFSLQDGLDLPVIERFTKIITGKGVIAKIYKEMSVPQVIKEISSLEYLIGMRFHANLVAAKAGVKILGLNYDIKIKNLAQSVGFPSINPYGCEVLDGIKELVAVNVHNYKIPEFTMKLG